MAKRANPTIIGAFVVGAAVLALVGVLAFGGGGLFSESQKYVLYFDRSLKGLTVGAPVTFRGVQIGKVEHIRIVTDLETLEFRVPVVIEVERNVLLDVEQDGPERDPDSPMPSELTQLLIEKGLRAQLEMRSVVTGLLEVSLDFYPDTPATMVTENPPYPEIPTIPSEMEQLGRTLQELPFEEMTSSLLQATKGVEKLVSSPDIPDALASTAKAAREIAELSRKANERLDGLAAEAERGLGEARSLMRDLDEQIGPVTKDLHETLAELRKLAANLNARSGPVLTQVEKTATTAQSALAEAETTLRSARQVVEEDSRLRQQVGAALREIERAARSMRDLADTLQRQPESLIHGRKEQ